MYLYHLTLQRATGILRCVSGNFSAPKAQELIVSRGRVLELLRPDESGKLHTILTHDVFGTIRSLHPFRLTGGNRDYLVVGSDSGRIVILRYDEKKNRFVKVQEETFGKSGCRRIVPGQYLAIDVKGRAVMIGAIEKQKLVYILNRDAAAKLTISSPLEAHKSHTILFDIAALDVGFENPQFVCLEIDYQDSPDNKRLVTYELDLGLNHVVRKHTQQVFYTSNMLIPVPGGSDGPGGVLVCSENMISYMSHGMEPITERIPQRADFYDSQKGLLLVSSATHRQKGMFFFLVQSEFGDLYKVDISYKGGETTGIKVTYFDTVPVGSAISVMKNGCLFVAAEAGDHFLYQFHSIGEEEESMTQVADDGTPLFRPRQLKNLSAVDRLDSFAPILESRVVDTAAQEGGGQQIYALCGTNAQSSLRLIRHGLAVSEMAVSDLPAVPNGIWTIKTNSADSFDTYIVVSFSNGTLVLSIGETVEEVSDAESGFLGENTTLLVSLLGENAIIQVHPTGIRYIRGKDMRIEWKTPHNRVIVHAAANSKQVVIALSGGDLLYFELDDLGQLVEIGKKELGHEVTCLDIAPIPAGRQRSRFLGVGDANNTVRLYSLYPDEDFERLSVLNLTCQPKSLCLLSLPSSFEGESSSSSSFSSSSSSSVSSDELFLSVGLSDGVLLRTVVDSVTGEITDTRRRFLGAKPVQLFKIKMGDTVHMLAKSTRCWLCYNHQGKFFMTPLSYVPLQCATNFSSEQCSNGVVGFFETTLRIFTIDRLGDTFNQVNVPVRYTPRKLLLIPSTTHAVVMESSCSSFSPVHDQETIQQLAEPIEEEMNKHKTDDMMDDDEEKEEENDLKQMAELYARQKNPEKVEGRPVWSSCLRIFDTSSQETISLLELEKGEGAFSLCYCVFASQPDVLFVIVGCAVGMDPMTRSCTSGSLNVYYYNQEMGTLTLYHKTDVEGIPTAVHAFQGRLLVGFGKTLRLYDLGKKKLLRKCENISFPRCIRSIQSMGNRIYVTDIAESFHFCSYRKGDNSIDIFADDPISRWSTGADILDYDTVTGADKFGNLFVLRLKSELSEEIEQDHTGNKKRFEIGHLNGAPYKLDAIINFHIGDVITSLHKTSLVPGGNEVVLYTTIVGGIGAMLPFVSREDIDFFQHLEMHMRSEFPPLCGRDHLAFRSSYSPCKDVIDGDLCEQFTMLDLAKQKKIAAELDRSPSEVLKKLEDIRHMIL